MDGFREMLYEMNANNSKDVDLVSNKSNKLITHYATLNNLGNMKD
jgi:hypothetical protein